jgi:hypothetical protein
MRKLFIFLALAGVVSATDSFLSHQGGTSIPLQTWTALPSGGWPISAVGYEKASYSPAAGCSMFPGTYHETNNEFQQGLACFSYVEQRWSILQDGGVFHDSYQDTAGHDVGQLAWMPLYNSWWLVAGGSGSNEPERPNITFWLDPGGQVARNKETGIAPNYLPSNGSSTLNTAAMDQYHGLIVDYPNQVGNLEVYDPSLNQYSVPTVSGTAPANAFWSSAYNSLDHRVYFFGDGLDVTMFAFDAGSNTWSTITQNPDPVNGTPALRKWAGWAFDPDDNLFLLVSGYDSTQTNIRLDTWAFHVDTLTWQRLATTAPWSGSPSVSFERLTYDEASKVFVVSMEAYTGQTGQFTGGSGGYSATYAFCYANCPNAGRISNTYAPSAGYINTKFTGTATLPNSQVDEGSVQSSSVAVDGGGNLFAAWLESGTSFDATGDERQRHPYIAESANGGVSWSLLGGAWNSLDGTNTESTDLHLTVAGTTPWVCWSNTDIATTANQLKTASWGGSSWTVNSLAARGGAGYFRGPNAITAIGTTAYVVSIESREIFSWANVYVDSCTPGSCSTVGGALNILTTCSTPCSRASSVSISNNGSVPYVAWTEEQVDANSAYYPVSQTPQVFAKYWNGSSWVQITSGSLNINTANWASDVATTYFAGNLYVAWNERTLAGNPKLYVKQCSNTACALIGNGINKDTTNGWPVHPRLTNDGTNVILTWEEQQNVAQRQRLYAQSWNGSAWVTLGAAINADAVNGSVSYSSATVTNGKPAVLWTESTPGNLRQVYAKFWNGSGWMNNSLACSISPSTLGPWTQGQSVNATLTGSNCSPSTWVISSGSLPGGLSLDALSGAIAGTISTAGAFSPTIAYDTASQPYAITVTVAPSSGAIVSGGRLSGGVISH